MNAVVQDSGHGVPIVLSVSKPLHDLIMRSLTPMPINNGLDFQQFRDTISGRKRPVPSKPKLKPEIRSIDDEWEAFGLNQGPCALCNQDVYSNAPTCTIGSAIHPLHDDCAKVWFACGYDMH